MLNIAEIWQFLINTMNKEQSNCKETTKKLVNFQTEKEGEMGQPDYNFGPRYKKCTLGNCMTKLAHNTYGSRLLYLMSIIFLDSSAKFRTHNIHNYHLPLSDVKTKNYLC